MSNNKDIWNWEKDIDRIFKKWFLNNKKIETYKYLNNDIRSITKLLNTRIKQGISAEEALEEILDEIYNVGVEYSEISNSLSSKLYQLEGVKYLTNLEVLKEKYTEYVDLDKKNISIDKCILDSNVNLSARTIIAEAMEIIKENEISQNVKSSDEKNIKDLSIAFNDVKNTLELNIREQQIKIMECIGEFLEKTGTLKKYLTTHNTLNSYVDGVNFKYKFKSEGQKDEIGLKDIFTEDYLKKQDLEHIEALSAFWQNRFAKQLKSYNKGLFLAAQTTSDKVNLEEDGQLASQKLLLIERICTCIDVNIKSNLDLYINRDLSDKENKDNISNEIVQIIASIEEKYGEKYQEKIKEIDENASKAKISDEITVYLNSLSAIKNVYKAKTALVAHMMRGLKNKKYSENWGVMKEADGGIDRYVLIGIDIEKFNMPLRLHLKKEELEDLNIGEIPEYLGSEDFKDMKTNVFMPLNRRQIKEIITELKKKPDNKRLLHLRYLSKKEKKPEHWKREKKPEHLKKDIVEDNKNR